MIIKTSNVKIYAKILRENKEIDKYLFLIHGFTGSEEDWENIAPEINENYNLIGIDLIGHGRSESPSILDYYSTESIQNQVTEVVEHFKKKNLFMLGYSMGGRVLMNVAVKNPEMFKGLIIESASAGFRNKNAREKRIKEDEELAKFIESHSTAEFADYWLNIDLFNTLRRFSEEKRQKLKESRIQNNRVGLANIIRGFGTGSMPPLYSKLKNIKSKTLVISGDLDTKFTSLCSQIAKAIPDAKHKVLKNSGHNTHIEVPKLFLKEVNGFLKGF